LQKICAPTTESSRKTNSDRESEITAILTGGFEHRNASWRGAFLVIVGLVRFGLVWFGLVWFLLCFLDCSSWINKQTAALCKKAREQNTKEKS